MENMKKWQIPAFGHWDYYDDLPITQYLESAWQDGANAIPGHFWEEEEEGYDQFKVPVKPVIRGSRHCRNESKGGLEYQRKERQRKQRRRVCDLTITQQAPRGPIRAPMAIDEDLYKIPPELLNQKKSKRKSSLRNLLSGCLSLNCVS